ncbi:uncharacterized protein LOC110451971 isoform X2 [Mizuhopecten yessoensis]|uniref:uncharacterized protein LOC110451971 isoform X2 n=1 Tax=Mizuhopecten yessoensis TaxID=6573 RepID=UPI000B4590D3|nr:uncharacterized protein LOC110451971 isoform X2 [Mizuhopecten yessoensis]
MDTSLSSNTLFRLATKRFVKSIGGPNLLPVPNVTAGNLLSPLGIVVKRPTKKWFRRTKYDYSIRQTNITNLLEDKSDLDVEMSEIPHVLNCRSSDCTTVEARTGLSVLKTFFASCKIIRYKCHTFTSGRTKTKNVAKRHLMEALKNRKIDVNDLEIRQILQACRDSVLCVVVSVIRTTERMDITEETKTEVGGDLKIDLPDGKGELSFGRGKKNFPELSINPTVLAYDVCELEVDMTTGDMTVLLDPELRGGFINFCSTLDVCEFITGGPSENYMRSLYETLKEMTSEERNIVREVVRTTADDADIICQILYQRNNYQDSDESGLEKGLRGPLWSRSNSSCSSTSDSTGYDTDRTLQSNDDETLPIQTPRPASFYEDDDDSGSDMCPPDLFESMSNSSCSTTSGSSGCPSEPASPTNDDVTSPIKTSSTDVSIVSLTTKPLAFRRLLQQVLGWGIMENGTMIQPNDKSRMDLFECFFVLLKRLHQERTDVFETISSLSSETRNVLWEVYRQKFVPRDEDRSEDRKRQLCEEVKKLEKIGNDIEEFTKMEQLVEYVEERSYTRCAIFSMLLALS